MKHFKNRYKVEGKKIPQLPEEFQDNYMLYQLCDGDISRIDKVLKIKIVDVKKWIFCRKYEAWVEDQLTPKPKGN